GGPAGGITGAGCAAKRRRRVSARSTWTSSALTILRTCCAGFSGLETSAPKALSLTFLMNDRTTGRATSASRSAIRISRAVAAMSAADNLPLPRRVLEVALRRAERVADPVAAVLEVGGGAGQPSGVVGLGQAAFAAEVFESRAEAVGEGIEHGGVGPRSRGRNWAALQSIRPGK